MNGSRSWDWKSDSVRGLLFGAVSLLLAQTAAWAVTPRTDVVDRTVLPIPPAPFAGEIRELAIDSKPDWSPSVRAPEGAPNVVVVMTDDVGFGAFSTFGGPVATPNLDRLAQMGLRFNQFHTIGVCSPSRAALLTGRNHHAVGAGQLADTASGYPGYDALLPRSAATIARILTGNGYASAFYGKHHNVRIDEVGPAGPFDRWPLGLGFQHFLGFIGGDAHQWQPHLYRDQSPVEAKPDEHLDELIADDSIRWVRNVKSADPGKPFFLYIATGAGHGPYHAPPEWLARFRGQFDQGWDAVRASTFRRQKQLGIVPAGSKMTARPPQIPAWKDLSPVLKQANARTMEAFAAHVAFQDDQFGRILDELQRMGQLGNTLVIFIEGDNGGTAQNGSRPTYNEIGASANGASETDEQLRSGLDSVGGPDSYAVNSAGWAYAMNTPFPWFKHVPSHLGGARNGMVMAWPDRMENGGQIRTAFSHVIDIAPTILDAAGIPAPVRVDGVAQQRMDGISLLPILDDPKQNPDRTQYFELDGNRAIYRNGWLASTTPLHMPWEKDNDGKGPAPQWSELYDLRRDYAQADNLAARHPEKLDELKAVWDAEARRNHVLPIDTRSNQKRALSDPNSPRMANFKREATLWGKGVSVTDISMPIVGYGSFTVTARIELTEDGASGPMLAGGSRFGGWAFYLKDGRPAALAAPTHIASEQTRVIADDVVEPGKHVVTYVFDQDARPSTGGRMTISVDGKTFVSGRIGKTSFVLAGLGETWDVGQDTGVPVTNDYPPDDFAGEIDSVKISLGKLPAN